MSSLFTAVQRVFLDLRRRHVFRVAGLYAIVAYGVMQVANNFFPPLGLPPWTLTLVAGLCVLGFPFALVLAYAYEITPDGVRRAERGAPGMGRGTLPLRGIAAAGVLVLLGGAGWAGYRVYVPAQNEVRAVAVLPFRSMSMEPENEHFSDGMTEEILTALSRLHGMRVISHTSVMQYKMMPKPLPEIGRELGVDHVLEGSVRRVGNQVRVTAQLIDARTDEHLWAQNYDREVKDILAIQSEIARQIAVAMQARLSPEERAHLAQTGRRTVNPDAYDAYLRGLHQSNAGQLTAAAATLTRAVELDPTFAPAHASLARTYYFLGFFGTLPPQEAFGKMREAATRALALDERSSDAHATVALARLHLDWDWHGAERHFRRALELSPNNAEVRHDYAHFLLAMGRNRESAAESTRAMEVDPLNVMLTACAGWHRLPEREYDYAIARSLRALGMMPDMFWPEMVLGWAYEQKGMYPEAVVAFRKASAHTGQSPFALGALGHALAMAGERAPAREILRQLEARAEAGYVSAYDLAVVHAGLGETEAAIGKLQQAFAERSGFFVHVGWDPRFAHLRGNPRVAALIRRMGLQPPAVEPRMPVAEAP